jgi:hypothetical protein
MHFTTLVLVLAFSVSLVSTAPSPRDHSDISVFDTADSATLLERRGQNLDKQWNQAKVNAVKVCTNSGDTDACVQAKSKVNDKAENIVSPAMALAKEACFGRPKKNQEGNQVALSACMTAKWGARDLANTYLYAGMTTKEIMSAAKARKKAICASLPDR